MYIQYYTIVYYDLIFFSKKKWQGRTTARCPTPGVKLHTITGLKLPAVTRRRARKPREGIGGTKFSPVRCNIIFFCEKILII